MYYCILTDQAVRLDFSVINLPTFFVIVFAVEKKQAICNNEKA